MHSSRNTRRIGRASLAIVIASLLCWPSATPAQFPTYPGAPVPDPLEFLLPGEPPEKGKIRLALTLLRAPAADVAKALAQDNEAGGMSWHRWLLEAKTAKKLELMAAPLATEAAPGEPFKAGYQRPYHFIRQGESSQLWARIMQQTTPGLDPEVWDEMLEELSEEPVGTLATGQMALALDQAGAEMTLRYNFTPNPQKRPSPAWTHPYFPAPKLLFRSWQIYAHALVPLREPFLLGVQMEPATDGQPDTEHVWALFGKLTLAPDLAAKKVKGTPLESSAGAVQSWTLDLPAKMFHPWLMSRRSDDDDGKMLQQWLARTNAAGEARVLSVVSAATPLSRAGQLSQDDSATVSSSVKWNDSAGFEPAHNDRVFRPCVAEDGEFFRRHELNAQLHGTSIKRGSSTAVVGATLTQMQPSTPLRWQRWKHAMEGTEEDEGNLELAEACFQNAEGRTLETEMSFQPGKTTLTSAVQRHGRVQATFVRIVDGMPPPQTPQPAPAPQIRPAPVDPFGPGGGPSEALPQANATVWQIDTPLDWMGKVLATGPDPASPLAALLLEAVQKGTATVAAMNTRCQTTGNRSQWYAAEPVNYYGGAYVNTAPHARGIYFNMRNLGQKMVGETERLDITLNEQAALAEVNAELDSSGPPVWRHWGIWQPGVSGTNATSSGIRLPAFPAAHLHLSAQVPLGQPQVVAVTLAPEAVFPGSPGKRLRWWVVRVSLEDDPAPAPVPPPSSGQRSSLFQAVVLPLPKAEAIPSDSQPLAERLLAEAAAGNRPVLDLATVFRLGTSDYGATLASGTEYHFTNGRYHPYTEDQAALINATAVMPPDTKYEDQITLANRMVGSKLELTGENWKLTRDASPPEVVTDTFRDVRYEFPYQGSNDPKRTSVSVQRPIFNVVTAEGALPEPGKAAVTRLTDDTVLVLRVK